MSKQHLATSILIALAASLALTGAATTLRSHAAPRVATDGFRFQGEPIHPKLIEEFESWLADNHPPSTVVVDVAAATGTNEYSDAVETSERELVRYANGAAWYGYEHLGQMTDGVHVLRTASSGGGSGIFQNLLFVRMREDEARTPDGDAYARVLLEVVGRFVLGDRDDAKVEVLGDRVVVGASQYRALATTLDFGR